MVPRRVSLNTSTHNGSLERTCEGGSYDKTQSLKLSLVAPFAVFSFQMSWSYFSHAVSCIKLLITLLCVHTHSSGIAPAAHLLILDCKPDMSICSGLYEQTANFIHTFFGEAIQCKTNPSVLIYLQDFKSNSKKSILLYRLLVIEILCLHCYWLWILYLCS